MAGRRHKSFRSGDLSEELGVLLLKGIAAVATVPRPEDVGVDAVATLLREEEEGNLLIAEDSFFVQFKTSTDKKVKFKDHEIRWLEGLKLPYFIGSVRKEDSAIDLYAGHRLSNALIFGSYNSIELVLDPNNKTFLGMNAATEAIKGDYRRVNIGPPLLSWSVADLADRTFPTRAYECLKPYVETEQRNVDYRGIRYHEVMKWETGGPPEVLEPIHYQANSEDDILKVFQSIHPHLAALSLRASLTKDRSALELAVQLVDYMRNCGFDPAPNNIYHQQLQDWDKLAFPDDQQTKDGPGAANDA